MNKFSGLLLATLLFGFAWPVPADELITRHGQVIKTEGPWKVKGQLVVFTNEKGILTSIRLSEVDLEASTAATDEANRPPPPAPTVSRLALAARAEKDPRDPVLILTNSIIWFEDQQNQEKSKAAKTRGRPTKDQFPDGELSGEVFNFATQIGQRSLALEEKHDLDTAAGMQAAANDIAAIARDVRSWRATASVAAQEMLNDIAAQFDELARLARQDPEEAVRQRRKLAQK